MLTFGEKEDYVSGYVSFNFEHPVPLEGSRQAPCSRSYGRVGSAVSVFGLGRFGSALAVRRQPSGPEAIRKKRAPYNLL